MARRVIKTEKAPLEIKPQKESVWICMCGLSRNQPLCDGSHKRIQDETENELYEYDDAGNNRRIDK